MIIAALLDFVLLSTQSEFFFLMLNKVHVCTMFINEMKRSTQTNWQIQLAYILASFNFFSTWSS